MTTQTVEAVYEDGSFRLIAPLDMKLADGQKVRLVVQPIQHAEEILALAGQVYEGLTDEEIDAVEKHFRRRKDFFGEDECR